METGTTHLEAEVKFHLPEAETLARKLRQLGARLLADTKEVNVVYDTSDRRLQKNDMLLRLRSDDAVRLTVKRRPATQSDRVKLYRETEVTVGDFAAMDAILRALGFAPVRRYEKRRRTYRFEQATVCLDHLPMGDFLEIEAPEPAIRPLAEKLGLCWRQRILANYLAIFDRLRQKAGLAFTDLTFANFGPGVPGVEQVLEEITADAGNHAACRQGSQP